jgi:hypothetical protein
VSPHPRTRRAGFTVVELLIGVSLSLMVMTAVLSSYVFLARSFTRTIGLGLLNQPTLESQGRRALAYFTQDVQASSAIVGTPSTSTITLTVPRNTGGTKNITYYYNSTGSAVTVSGYSVPANALARIDVNTSTGLTLHYSLLSCSFTYYDTSGNPYTTYTNYMLGLKQVSLVFTSQTGSSVNKTLTQVYKVASPRLLFRNKSLLP